MRRLLTIQGVARHMLINDMADVMRRKIDGRCAPILAIKHASFSHHFCFDDAISRRIGRCSFTRVCQRLIIKYSARAREFLRKPRHATRDVPAATAKMRRGANAMK